MRDPISMPVLSDTMETGRLHQWLKQPGDPVKKGEVVAEVESDKAIMDVEAPRDGYLAAPLAPAESDVPVGKAIGYLVDSPAAVGESGQTGQPAHAPPPQPEPASAPSAAPAQASRADPGASAMPSEPPPDAAEPLPAVGAGHRASPYARGLARELGIPLAAIRPGADGVIRSPQVLAAALAGPRPRLEAGPPYRYKLYTPMHRAVAEHMAATVSIPTFRVASRVDLAPLIDLAHRTKHSLSLLLARACALTIGEHPHFNAAYTPEGLAVRQRVDIGVAVDIPGGLVTPVLRDVAQRPLEDLAQDWYRFKGLIKQGRLQPADYEGATFYLSNLGTFPVVSRFEAIVPLGAAAILAVGAAQQGVTELTLSCDHRVVFGADAARFLADLEGRLGAPAGL